jgi:hypothetical protein
MSLELCGVPGAKPILGRDFRHNFDTRRLMIMLLLFAEKALRTPAHETLYLSDEDLATLSLSSLWGSVSRAHDASLKRLVGVGLPEGKDFWSANGPAGLEFEDLAQHPLQAIFEMLLPGNPEFPRRIAAKRVLRLNFRVFGHPYIVVEIQSGATAMKAEEDDLAKLLELLEVRSSVESVPSVATCASFASVSLAMNWLINDLAKQSGLASTGKVRLVQSTGQRSRRLVEWLITHGWDVELFLVDPETVQDPYRMQTRAMLDAHLPQLRALHGLNGSLEVFLYHSSLASDLIVYVPDHSVSINLLLSQTADRVLPLQGHADPVFTVSRTSQDFGLFVEVVERHIASLGATRQLFINGAERS